MKYDIVSQHDLIAHALGKKDSIDEDEEHQKKKQDKDIPKDKLPPRAPDKKTKPSPKPTPKPAKKPAPAPSTKKAPAPAPAKADPVVYDVKVEAQITAEPKKDAVPSPNKEKKAESHNLKPKEDKHAKIVPVHHEVVEVMPLAVSKKPQQHKMTAKEIADLRVQHGIQYEKEHNVDHFIEQVTHPEYEITGWIHDEGESQMMHDFKYEHEDEQYGDEFESGKAHLHLAPTHKLRKQ